MAKRSDTMEGRDYSRPSEVSRLRPIGDQRIHCVPGGDAEDYEERSRLRSGVRGSEESEDGCERLRRGLREG